jgi:hypothetical protein
MSLSEVALFSAFTSCSAASDRAFRRASAISAVAGDGTVGSVAGSAVLVAMLSGAASIEQVNVLRSKSQVQRGHN